MLNTNLTFFFIDIEKEVQKVLECTTNEFDLIQRLKQ